MTTNTISLDCTRWRHEAIGDEESINHNCKPCNANGCNVGVYIFSNWITWWILTVELWLASMMMSVQHILLTLILRQICNYYSSQNLKVESSGKLFFMFTVFFSYTPLSAWKCVVAKLLRRDRAQAPDRPWKRTKQIEKRKIEEAALNSISFDLLNVRERPHSNSTKVVNASSLCFCFVSS